MTWHLIKQVAQLYFYVFIK